MVTCLAIGSAAAVFLVVVGDDNDETKFAEGVATALSWRNPSRTVGKEPGSSYLLFLRSFRTSLDRSISPSSIQVVVPGNESFVSITWYVD